MQRLREVDREGFVAEYRPLLACPAGVECNPDELPGARCEALACWVDDDAYDCEGCYDESRPDLSGDSSGARLSLSAAAERIASSLSGGYQEYKE